MKRWGLLIALLGSLLSSRVARAGTIFVTNNFSRHDRRIHNVGRHS